MFKFIASEEEEPGTETSAELSGAMVSELGVSVFSIAALLDSGTSSVGEVLEESSEQAKNKRDKEAMDSIFFIQMNL